MHATRRFAAALLIATCSACSPPQVPEPDTPPEPQSAALRDAIHAPLDAAAATGDALEAAAARQRETMP